MQFVTLARNLAFESAGSNSAARIAIIAITTSSSISVKALRFIFPLLSGRRQNFYSVDLRIFYFLCECDLQPTVRDRHGDAFDVRAKRAARLLPDIKIGERMALRIKRKDALTWTRNAFERFSKMQ